jgi:hypothetical protein
MSSELPWSALTTRMAPVASGGGDEAAEAEVDGFDGDLHRGEDAGVADHVAVGEVDADELVLAGAHGVDDLVRDFGGFIQGRSSKGTRSEGTST